MITRTQYMNIKSQLSFNKPLWVTLVVMLADAILFLFCFWLLDYGTTAAYIASQFLFAVFFFHCFAILHDAGHGNIHRKQWVNAVVGHVASIGCFLPFYPWKFMHQEHHVWSGNIDRDPAMEEIKPLMDKNAVPLIAKVVWRSYVPLVAFNQHFVFWSYPIKMWRTKRLKRNQVWLCAFSTLYLISIYILLFKFLPEWFNWQNFWLSFVFYLLITEFINLPHHLEVPAFREGGKLHKLHPWEQALTTRSCDYPYYISELLALNFNLHTEHHFFPNMPWYRLKQVRKLIKPALGKDYSETTGIRWHLKNRRLDASEVLLMKELKPESLITS